MCSLYFLKLSKTEVVVLIAISLVTLLLLFPPVVKVWIGHFHLTVKVNADQEVNLDSIQFAVFWFKEDADHVMKNRDGYESEFERPNFNEDQSMVVLVPMSGRTGAWMTNGTYHHAEYLVIDYQLKTVENIYYIFILITVQFIPQGCLVFIPNSGVITGHLHAQFIYIF